MKKATLVTAAVVIFAFVLAGFCAAPAVMAGNPQTNCPVLSGKIDPKIYYDYKGQRIFFCCQACVDQFKADPEKYLEKMKKEGVTPSSTP